MDGKKIIPIGVENFEKLRQNDFYYVDKTGLIRDLLQNRADVTLFTRPRRFGKSLNPVISLSLKGVEGDNYLEAYQVMADLVLDLASQFDFLPDSEKLNASDKQRYGKLLDDDMRKSTLTGSLKLLSKQTCWVVLGE